MKQQSQEDANIINKLREQMSISGNSTMNKLHTIVAKHDMSASHQAPHSSNAQASYHQRQLEEMTRCVEEKDHIIRQLQQNKKEVTKTKEVSLKEKNDLRN